MRGAGFLSFILDLVLDPRCIHCGAPLGPGGAPPAIPAGWPREAVEFFLSTFSHDLGFGISVPAAILCPVCWLSLSPAGDSALSGEGEAVPVVAPFMTDGILLEVIRFLKFGGGRTAASPLAWWMAFALADHLRNRGRFNSLQNIVLIPVPLHGSRRRSRGYNQAALLAEGVCRIMGLEWDEEGLKRARRTRPQSKLSSGRRKSNVTGAFALTGRGSLSGRDIILVDDLVTTGETALACVDVLLKASPSTITVLAAGRKGPFG